MKPDTIEDDSDVPIIFTQKPDTKDEAIAYDKPNTYDEDQDYKRPSLPQEVLDDLIVRAEFIDGKRAPIKTNDDDTSSKFTSSLLSHIPSSTTGLTSSPPISLSPSVSTISTNSNSSTISTATTRLALLKILKSKPMEDLISFDLRKYSFTRPHEHDVYIKGTKEQVYKKVQPHSYSWGFQNILYKITDGKIKVAEARRRAFKKEITVEWGDFPILVGPETFNDDNEDDDTSSIVSAVTNTKSNQLYNKTNSHLLFTYETEFEGFKIRWKRASLLSHDMICEIRLEQKKKWHVIAEFDSHRMGYFVHLGEVIIDKNALKLVDRTDHFEAHIIITCCTLIDLMREVVEKAVGLSKGGVVGSDK